jgi:hypothetical protein
MPDSAARNVDRAWTLDIIDKRRALRQTDTGVSERGFPRPIATTRGASQVEGELS